jgi:hypothetical protein
VKPHQQACTAPFVPGAAQGSCVCPQGTVQQGRECVAPRTGGVMPPISPGGPRNVMPGVGTRQDEPHQPNGGNPTGPVK